MTRSSIVARRYAEAYFALAKDAADIAGWRNELSAVVDVFSHDEVGRAVVNPRLPLSQRVRLGLDLLDGASSPARNLARLLIERRRVPVLPEILAHYDLLADRESGVVRAEMTTAVPLDERTEREISNALSERLKELEAEGVVARCVYPETPVRIEYRLTEKGKALAPVIEAIGEWSQRWIELDAVPVE